MYLNNPFYFIKKYNSTTNFADNYIFYNNRGLLKRFIRITNLLIFFKGLGFLIGNFLIVALLIWENYAEKIYRTFKQTEKMNTEYLRVYLIIFINLIS